MFFQSVLSKVYFMKCVLSENVFLEVIKKTKKMRESDISHFTTNLHNLQKKKLEKFN